MLFDDVRLVRPTEMLLIPRVLDMIHRHYLVEVARRSGDGADPDEVRSEVMAEMRAGFLGDRIATLTFGSAPTTPEIHGFIEDCFRVPVRDTYGSTESGVPITVNGRIARPLISDYRLRDVPELGYFTTDKPYPRGELCVQTDHSVPGYYKRPEATAALFDEDGYLVTGDIVEERGPDQVAYIGRRHDVLKLNQGEYVAIGALETAFESGSRVIHQIYVYGNSARSHLLAVVVPSEPQGEPDLRALIRAELKRIGQEAGLKPFEVPRDFIIERKAFSVENGLLSAVLKRRRPQLEAKYGEDLERLYADLERNQNQELMALHAASSDLSVLEKVGRALEAVLGVQDVDVEQPYSFSDLGGDSLGATAFGALLEDVFGVALPVTAILSPAGNPRVWADAIEMQLAGGQNATATFASVHGEGARELDAADLDISRFLGGGALDNAPTEPPAGPVRTVLVTGATGFLGRFLCLAWLERVAQVDGKVICLVRAADEEAAKSRLTAAFEGSDPDLEERFHSLARGHLDLVAGDVALSRLGLSEYAFARLASEVDRIVHPAALVNHVLGYEDLFEPNVAGTAEVIRLALTTCQKPIDFVSSVAATMLVDRTTGVHEDSSLREKATLANGYGWGYGASKWAAEHLLHSAQRRFGLPVNIFRGDMMLAHSRYPGQINVPDVFTRLLYSIIVTGLAPESFYVGGQGAAHYDGLPVDFVAGAIAGIGADGEHGLRTFHVLNHHADDGLSLDTFVDWIQAAGYTVERVPDYRDWIERFEGKLRALPEDRRRHSSLSVLDSLRRPVDATEPMMGSHNFEAAIRELPIGPEAPHVTRKFIEKTLADMRMLSLIPEP
jgi:fatty acid CoA ligase FadD9